MPVYVPGGVNVIPMNAVIGLLTALNNASFAPIAVESTASRVSVLSDAGQYIRFTSFDPQSYTLQPTSSVAWKSSCEIHGRNAGVGEVTLVAGSDVTINPPYLGTLRIPTGGTFTLKRVGDTDEWDLFGQTVPV